jgi:hypothetical protein
MPQTSDALLRKYQSLDRWSDFVSWGALLDGPVLLALITGDPAAGLLILLPWLPWRFFLGWLLGFGLWPWNFLEKAKDAVYRRYLAELAREKIANSTRETGDGERVS